MLLCELESMRSKEEGDKEPAADRAMAYWHAGSDAEQTPSTFVLATRLTLSESNGFGSVVNVSILDVTLADISAIVSL